MTDFTLADGQRVHLIGDPHLGRKFEAGVPSHRRGQREIRQAAHFSAELGYDADIIVQVGDLFDHPAVSREVVLTTARTCIAAAENNPSVLYIHMAGNHDQPRNLGSVGAWPIFKKMIEGRLPNLIAVDRPAVVCGLAIFPWEWDRRADEQVSDLAGQPAEHAVGHWDLSVFDDKDDHLCPAALLRSTFGEALDIWSGHYHRAGTYTVMGIPVTCTGSMEPYTHAEDPDGQLYVTLTLAEALDRDDLYDKYVRVVLAPGEEMPDIDCMGLTHKRERDEKEAQVTAPLDDFDFQKLVLERIKDRDPAVRVFIEERMAIHVEPPEEQR